MEKGLYAEYQKYFKDVDGHSFLGAFNLIAAAVGIAILYIFNVWIYSIKPKDGILLTISLLILTVLAVIGLFWQINLRNKAKEICQNARIIKAELITVKRFFLLNRSFHSEVIMLYPDGIQMVRVLKCGKSGINKYKKYGVYIIQAKYSKKEIILKPKNLDNI